MIMLGCTTYPKSLAETKVKLQELESIEENLVYETELQVCEVRCYKYS